MHYFICDIIMNLDQVNDLKQLDPSDVYNSILNIPKQIKQTYENTKNLSFPKGYQDIDEVLVCGMGGSSLGAHFVSTLLRDSKLIGSFALFLPSIIPCKEANICSALSGVFSFSFGTAIFKMILSVISSFVTSFAFII